MIQGLLPGYTNLLQITSPPASFQITLDTNFGGTMNLTEALKPYLRNGSGRVVNVSSRCDNIWAECIALGMML